MQYKIENDQRTAEEFAKTILATMEPSTSTSSGRPLESNMLSEPPVRLWGKSRWDDDQTVVDELEDFLTEWNRSGGKTREKSHNSWLWWRHSRCICCRGRTIEFVGTSFTLITWPHAYPQRLAAPFSRYLCSYLIRPFNNMPHNLIDFEDGILRVKNVRASIVCVLWYVLVVCCYVLCATVQKRHG